MEPAGVVRLMRRSVGTRGMVVGRPSTREAGVLGVYINHGTGI